MATTAESAGRPAGSAMAAAVARASRSALAATAVPAGCSWATAAPAVPDCLLSRPVIPAVTGATAAAPVCCRCGVMVVSAVPGASVVRTPGLAGPAATVAAPDPCRSSASAAAAVLGVTVPSVASAGTVARAGCSWAAGVMAAPAGLQHWSAVSAVSAVMAAAREPCPSRVRVATAVTVGLGRLAPAAPVLTIQARRVATVDSAATAVTAETVGMAAGC